MGGLDQDSSFNRYVRYYKHLIDRISSGTPTERKSLEELLKEEYPGVSLRDGSRHMFSREELRDFSRIFPEDLRKKILLPIILGKIHGISLYRFSECDSTIQAMIDILIREGLISRDAADLTSCVLRYDATRNLIKRYGSLIILTIYQKSYIDVSSSDSEGGNEP
ncbi:MAG: DUF61 family protein [Sulfolobales archaeon]